MVDLSDKEGGDRTGKLTFGSCEVHVGTELGTAPPHSAAERVLIEKLLGRNHTPER